MKLPTISAASLIDSSEIFINGIGGGALHRFFLHLELVQTMNYNYYLRAKATVQHILFIFGVSLTFALFLQQGSWYCTTMLNFTQKLKCKQTLM